MTIFFFENRTVYENMWKNTVQLGRPLMTMTLAHFMLDTLSLHTHTQYVTITVFTLQQWLHKRASMQRYMNTFCQISS